MDVRKIQSLKWVRPALTPPFQHPKPSGGAKLQGWRFEKAFGKYLQKCRFEGRLFAGSWFEFEDENGHGFAQPDFFIVSEKRVLIFECKLSSNARAWIQLHLLYGPLLGEFYSLPIYKVQVCKNLRGEQRYPVVHKASDLKNEVTWLWPGGLK